ncbi:MAG: hypothetical protein LBU04_02310 [Christensenellaceae bacterium]|jgi:stage III sporulation protein AD|nr:hypothetical protein [Christensenellaceae bacterium]
MIGKVITLAFIGMFAVGALRQIKAELAIFAALVTGGFILLLILEELSSIISVFSTLNVTSVGGELTINIIKIIGIGYITEYSASICDDYGTRSLAKKIQLAGKISIFGMSMPILLNIMTMVANFAK